MNQLYRDDPSRKQAKLTEANEFSDTMIQAVDAYVDENRVLGNSLISKARHIANQINIPKAFEI